MNKVFKYLFTVFSFFHIRRSPIVRSISIGIETSPEPELVLCSASVRSVPWTGEEAFVSSSRMVSCLKNSNAIRHKNTILKKSVSFAPDKVWKIRVDKLEEGEELQFDPSMYNCLQRFCIGWPCLSFDMLHDSLGLVRSEFPHTLYGVAGSQAAESSLNYIAIFKVSNIPQKENEEDVCERPGQPILQFHTVAHQGCVNRIRAMPQKSHICATWADTGHVQVWNFNSQLNALEETEAQSRHGANNINRAAPLFKFNGHKDEGFALDWSPVVPGRLISGDCNSCIHLWEPSSNSWNVDKNPFVGHKANVEDLQWSPTKADIFASCSVDGNISIWDSRIGRSPTTSIKAHDTDVNVISWNRLASCMIASGCDDGTFSVWDLRLIKKGSLVAQFEYHKQPITSIEWSPHEASTLAVSSADNELTIWDLSLERDEEGVAEFKANVKEQADAPSDLPPQLLFLHQGQEDMTELHWHQQIPGMIICTDVNCFCILMPSSIQSTHPSSSAS